MVFNRISTPVVLLIVLSKIKLGSSIICYDCNSLYDSRCGDEFDSFSLGVVNCSLRDPLEHLPDAVPTVCRTIKMEINEKIRVVRQCGYITDDTTDKPCLRKSSTDKLFVTYCSCSQDYCNGSGYFGQEWLPATICLVLLGLRMYVF